ncbi:hypothetical protein GQ42DRAFT_161676 [Ramicandelaber brevisporus]|nr:hypothetical protein GQ42DRAFT_161676 [Ramicandelaber brevisporus]
MSSAPVQPRSTAAAAASTATTATAAGPQAVGVRPVAVARKANPEDSALDTIAATPHGTVFATSPGGTRIVYDEDLHFLAQHQHQPPQLNRQQQAPLQSSGSVPVSRRPIVGAVPAQQPTSVSNSGNSNNNNNSNNGIGGGEVPGSSFNAAQLVGFVPPPNTPMVGSLASNPGLSAVFAAAGLPGAPSAGGMAASSLSNSGIPSTASASFSRPISQAVGNQASLQLQTGTGLSFIPTTISLDALSIGGASSLAGDASGQQQLLRKDGGFPRNGIEAIAEEMDLSSPIDGPGGATSALTDMIEGTNGSSTGDQSRDPVDFF